MEHSELSAPFFFLRFVGFEKQKQKQKNKHFFDLSDGDKKKIIGTAGVLEIERKVQFFLFYIYF